jgi:hypothetical protein
MSLNIEKCGIMLVDSDWEISDFEIRGKIEFTIDKCQIPVVEKYTYLGIDIDKGLNFETMVSRFV